MIQIVRKLTDKIHSIEFLQTHRKNSTDFTRNRTLTFPRLMSFMLNAINGSIQNELCRFFQVLDESPVSLVNVSTAAFCKARKKLSYRAFKELNNPLNHTFYQDSNVKLWHGLRLLAVDGSVTKPPKNKGLLEHFGKARNQSFQPAVRLSQLYDVKNKISIDLAVEPHSTGERNMALEHLKHAKKGDVIVYDRGYGTQKSQVISLTSNLYSGDNSRKKISSSEKCFIKSGLFERIRPVRFESSLLQI